MPRRYILTASERAGLVAIPTDETRREHLSELRTLSIAESDFSNTLLVFEKLVRLCFLQPRLAKEELFPC
jgi:hypothetical protein